MLIFKPRIKRCQCSWPDSLHTLGANESLLCNHVSDVLNCYKKACIGIILHRLIWMKFISMLSTYAQFEKYMYFRWRIIMVLTQSPAVLMFEDITGASNSWENMYKHDHLLRFQSSGRQRKISGIHLIMYLPRKITSSYIGVGYLRRRTYQHLRGTYRLIHRFYLLMCTKAKSYVGSWIAPTQQLLKYLLHITS